MILESDLEEGIYESHVERLIYHCGNSLSESDMQSQLKIRKLTAFLARLCTYDNQVKMIKSGQASKIQINPVQQRLFTRLQILCNMKRSELRFNPLFQIVQLSPRLMSMDDSTYATCMEIWKQKPPIFSAIEFIDMEKKVENLTPKKKKRNKKVSRRGEINHVFNGGKSHCEVVESSINCVDSIIARTMASGGKTGIAISEMAPDVANATLEDICRRGISTDVQEDGKEVESRHWNLVRGRKTKKLSIKRVTDTNAPESGLPSSAVPLLLAEESSSDQSTTHSIDTCVPTKCVKASSHCLEEVSLLSTYSAIPGGHPQQHVSKATLAMNMICNHECNVTTKGSNSAELSAGDDVKCEPHAYHCCPNCWRLVQLLQRSQEQKIQELSRLHEEQIQEMREIHSQAMQTAQLRLFIATNALENERQERNKIVEQVIADYINKAASSL